MRGLFVVVEGIEGSGKSTLTANVARTLRADGRDVLETREPGGTPLGDAVRSILLDDPSRAISPLGEAMLLSAARAQHVDDVLEPALAAGGTVVCDRYALATLAYQGYGRGVPLETLRALNALATRGCTPDLIIVVDVPVAVSVERIAARSASSGRPIDRMEREREAFHARVRDGYLELARSESNIVVLDGTRSPAEIAGDALRALAGAVVR
ncbi:MAG: dTMP kinase [Candidatus Eremiobacteraeota bacterium]|nr:dTMP kinase [Candidatus Eremiobacteraeota bacterium]